MPKKLLIIVTKGEMGGAQELVLNLSKELKRNGIDITIGFGSGEYLAEECARHKIPTVSYASLRRTHNLLSNLLFSIELRNFLNINKFDSVIFNSSNSLFGAIGAKKSKARPQTIFIFHGLSVLDPNYRAIRLVKWIYKIIFRILLCYVDRPVFVTKTNYQNALKQKIVSKGYVINNGIDVEKSNFYSKDEARKKIEYIVGKNFDNNIIIGAIGRLTYPKNYEFIIKIFPQILKRNSNIRLIIIGDGSEKERYKKIINNLGISNNVFLTGSVKNARQLLKAFDIFVLCSEYEGMPLVLIEALAAGLPIVASDIPGNIETLGSAGVFYRANNSTDFLDHLFNLIDNQALRLAYSEKAKTHSKRFSISNVAKKYLSLIF